MKKLWKKLKSICWNLRDYFSDYDDGYLTNSDKQWLLIGALIICVFTTLCTSWIMNGVYKQNNALYEQGLYDFLNAVATYTANLTDKEYEAVAEELRHQLAFTEFDADNDIEMYMKYIANTSEQCPLDQQSYPYRYYLVMTNNGEIQPIDYWSSEAADDNDVVELGSLWDEVSEARVSILYFPNKKTADISICSERGTVSAHKMKQIFCDDCIRNLFDMFEDTYMEELFIFDSETDIVYPIKECILNLDGYTLKIAPNESDGYSMNLTSQN